MARWSLADLVAELERTLVAFVKGVRVFIATFRGRRVEKPSQQCVTREPKLEIGDLPDSYGRTRLVALVVDPYLVHTYWEVVPDQLAEARRQIGADYKPVQAVLRFRQEAAGENRERSWFDVEIDLQPQNWYVHLWAAGKVYCADLGLRSGNGRFIFLARSNLIRTPIAWPEVKTEEHFMRIRGGEGDAEVVPAAAYNKPYRRQTAVLPTPASLQARPAFRKPVDSAELLRKKLTELHALRQWPGELLRTEQELAGTAFGPQFDRPDIDLTELAESRLIPGISSALLHSTHRES
jgi:hypothetical protein